MYRPTGSLGNYCRAVYCINVYFDHWETNVVFKFEIAFQFRYNSISVIEREVVRTLDYKKYTGVFKSYVSANKL